MAVLAAHSTGEGGEREAHGTHWREGDAGHHAELDRPTGDTLRSPTVTPKLQRLAAQAARDPERVFTTLAHLIDEDFLHEAYRHTSKSSAAGIDGVTAKTYAEHLDENLRDLHERLRSGRYQAAPVERVWIEKDDGGQRPIGKPAFEDKIVQRAVAMLLEAIYEQDFQDCSYGFRPGRSPHAALHAGPRAVHGTRASAGSWMQRCVDTSTALTGPGCEKYCANGSMMGGSCASSGSGCAPASWKTGC